METYRFLIIEDTPSHRQVFNEEIVNLSRSIHFKHIIDEADTYRKAIIKINKQRYDIIIIDKRIPGGPGDELVNRIQERYPFQRMVFITAYPTKKLKGKLELCKVHGYIQKSGDYRNILTATLRKIMKNQVNCFIITPYSREYLDFYHKKIEPFISTLGFKPILAKNIFHHDTLIKNIQREIRTSKFIIANISEKNPNVYYELGLCHQAKKPTILLTNNPRSIPSDLQGKKYINYRRKSLKSVQSALLQQISSIDIQYRS